VQIAGFQLRTTLPTQLKPAVAFMQASTNHQLSIAFRQASTIPNRRQFLSESPEQAQYER